MIMRKLQIREDIMLIKSGRNLVEGIQRKLRLILRRLLLRMIGHKFRQLRKIVLNKFPQLKI